MRATRFEAQSWRTIILGEAPSLAGVAGHTRVFTSSTATAISLQKKDSALLYGASSNRGKEQNQEDPSHTHMVLPVGTLPATIAIYMLACRANDKKIVCWKIGTSIASVQ